MKWNFAVPYVRAAPEKLLHYPEVSKISGKKIDWMYSEADDGYSGAKVFGPHTLELRGMPMGRTPEYMQERLRRFFSKFGPVKHCRAEPHPLDPYQCEGTAWVTFRERQPALEALQAPLKFPASLHDKVIHMRHLDSDKTNDADYFTKSKHWNRQLISLATQLHDQLSQSFEDKPISRIFEGLVEREWSPAESGPDSKRLHIQDKDRRIVPVGTAVQQRFGSWEAFLSEPPLDELFILGAVGDSQDVVVRARFLSSEQRRRILVMAQVALDKRLKDEMSVYWREGKIELPEYVQRRVQWWDHLPALPEAYQIMSRCKMEHRIYDERYLYKTQLRRARNEQRQERRKDWQQTRQKMLAEKMKKFEERRAQAKALIPGDARPVEKGWMRKQTARKIALSNE